MSRNKVWYSILSDAAQQRGIKLPFDDSDLLDDHDVVRLSEWVERNLKDAEPLTKEELILWQTICKTTSQQPGEHVDNSATPVPLSEALLQEATDDMSVLTQTLQDRTRTLEHQRRIKADLDNEFASASSHIISFGAILENQQKAEQQRMFFLNNEAELENQEKIRTAQEKIVKYIKVVGSQVQEKLRVDDRILGLLQASVVHTDPNVSARSSKYQSLLDTLQRAIVLSIKTRLDRIYLHEIETQEIKDKAAESPEEMTQTQNDLQSLYAEIEDVASMLVDNMYRSRMKAVEEELAFLFNQDAAHDALSTIEKLKVLTESTGQLATHYHLLQAHRSMYAIMSELQSHDRSPGLLEITNNDISSISDQTALLRYLNIEMKKDDASSEIVERLHERSRNLLRDSQAASNQIVADVNSSITTSNRFSQDFLPSANKYLTDVTQKSDELDNRIALAKSRFERASNAPDTDIYTRMRFVNDKSRHT